MALFTDGPPASVEDLAQQDSGVLQVAATEYIDLESKLALVHQEVGMELEALLERAGIETYGKENVVATPTVKLWHAFATLAAVYRDAYGTQLNDRYKAKWQTYQELSRSARERLSQCGVGLVRKPVPKAEVPNTELTAGTGPTGVHYLRATWTDGAAEGAPSEYASVNVEEGQTLRVSMAGARPNGATGWFVYAGTEPKACMKQNATPLAPGETYTLGAIAPAAPAGEGQAAEMVRVAVRRLPRG